MERIDVVIPTGKNIHESHYSILFTLRSILSQTVQPASVTIVENMPGLGVQEEVMKFYGNRVSVIAGIEKSPNIAYARNVGASRSDSGIIVFMDDDVILGYTDYFARIISIMDNNDFCCGAKRYWTPTKWFDSISLDNQFKHNLMILKDISYLPHSFERSTGEKNCSEFSYIGHFGAIKREVFHQIKGFDEDYEGWLYQDTDLMMRLVNEGYTYEILAYTDLFCFHLNHPAEKSRYQQINRAKFYEKMDQLNIYFNRRNFFGDFESNDRSVLVRRVSQRVGDSTHQAAPEH